VCGEILHLRPARDLLDARIVRSHIVLWVLVVACRPRFADDCATVNIAPGDRVTCKVPGWVDRAFDLELPASWDGASPLPVVIAYHGGGGNREGAPRVTCPGGDLDDPGCIDAIARARGYAVVYPDGTGSRPLRDVRTWNGGGGGPGAYCASGPACARDIDDIDYTDDLLAEVGAAIPIDPRRVFATGLSNGGAMSHRIGCERTATFAAIAPVGGANQHADGGGACGAMPVLHIHGTEDDCWPFGGGTGGCLEQSGRKTSVDETMAGWAARNGCAITFTDAPIPDRDPGDGATSFRRTWNGCAVATELIVVEGGGHTWPSGWPFLERAGRVTRDYGSEVILDFFDAHPRP
jgi:polyhydroxybutyrate depolymerase